MTMAKFELTLPSMGEGIIEATITRWLINEGEDVEEDQPVVEVATDKVDTEIHAPASGKLQRIEVQEGEVAKVGEILAIIGDESDSGTGISLAKDIEEEVEKPAGDMSPSADYEYKLKRPVQRQARNLKYRQAGPPEDIKGYMSPYLKNMAANMGLSAADIEKIQQSTDLKNITEEELHRLAAGHGGIKKFFNNLPDSNKQDPVIRKEQIYEGHNEVKEMNRLRKLISRHMVYSKHVSAHVTSFSESDVTNMVQWRSRNKVAFEEKHKQRLTLTPLIMEAVAQAFKEFPQLNISVDGDKIVYKKDINIGMATALPNGNLIVPVVKNAEQLSLPGLAEQVNHLAALARENKLKPTQVQGGTFTVTNLGQFGNITGTPIINQPEVAILAIGAIKKKPAVVETPEGDTIGIRNIMVLAMSYDHRVVDGMFGGMFVERVAQLLQNFDIHRAV